MCSRTSTRCINTIIIIAFVCGVIALILGILGYFLPFLFYRSDTFKYGFIMRCPLESLKCNGNIEFMYRIPALILFVIGIFFNLLALIYMIVMFTKYCRKSTLIVYLPQIKERVISFVLFLIAMICYIIGIAFITVLRNKYEIGASFILAWLASSFCFLAALLLLLILCGIRGKGSSTHGITADQPQHHHHHIHNKNNYAYENEMRTAPEVDVKNEVYRMYSRD